MPTNFTPSHRITLTRDGEAPQEYLVMLDKDPYDPERVGAGYTREDYESASAPTWVLRTDGWCPNFQVGNCEWEVETLT